MLTYRNIKPDEQYAEQIWKVEQGFPEWYRDASRAWHANFDEFLSFWRTNCNEIDGLFDDDILVAAVYLEFLSGIQLNIHVSVLTRVPEPDLVRWFESLKRQKAIDGFTVMTGWLMERNRGMLRVAAKAGFDPTGCTMDYGQSRGKILRWIQVRA